MKAYKLSNGNIVAVTSTANSESLQIELTPSGVAAYSEHNEEFLATQELIDLTVDSTELYSMAENAIAVGSNVSPSTAELKWFYALVEAVIS